MQITSDSYKPLAKFLVDPCFAILRLFIKCSAVLLFGLQTDIKHNYYETAIFLLSTFQNSFNVLWCLEL